MNRLLFKFKDRTIKEFDLDRIDTLSIGRASGNDIVIDNLAVSSNHAQITKDVNRYIVKDINSKNGTFLNGRTIEQAVLKNGDIITIGKHALVFLDRGRSRQRHEQSGLKTSSVPEDPGPDHTMFMDSEIYRRMLAESGDIPESAKATRAQVAFISGGTGSVELNRSLFTIGRSGQCDIVLQGFFSFLAGDPAAVISKTPEHHYINHAGGWMKPKINGKKFKGPVRLKNMDIIKIGSVTLQFAMGNRA